MDIYRPKKDPRPSRRKDKDNPYEIFSVGIDTDQPHFYVSFKDGQGVQICLEIDKAVFELLGRELPSINTDSFELDDLSFLNEWDRHIEHSELTESALHARAIADIESVELTAYKSMRNEQLRRAIAALPETQRRRLVMYYFDGLTYEEIAERERCTHPAVIKSVKAAISKLKKYFFK